MRDEIYKLRRYIKTALKQLLPAVLGLVIFAALSAASVLADPKMASSITRDQFVAACGKVTETARTRGYIYGDSRSEVPTADGKISCDRLVAKALWDLGFTDQQVGGITCGSMIDYLDAHGFVKSDKLSDIGYGSIVLIKHTTVSYWSHAFVTLSFDQSTMTFDSYDCGANSLIQSVQPFHNRSWLGTWRTSPVTVFNIPGGSGTKNANSPAKAAPVSYKVKLSETSCAMITGSTWGLTATVTPSLPEGKRLVWSSSDPSIAKVNASGKVTLLTPGTVKIKATVQGTNNSAACTFTVLGEPVTKVSLSRKRLTIGVGTRRALTAEISPVTASSYHEVKWSTDDSRIATVSDRGVITALRAGTVKIIAKAGDSKNGWKKAVCTVTVKFYPVKKIRLNKKKLSLKVGKKQTLKVRIYPSNASNKEIVWKTSNPKVAKVDKNGTVTALKKGNAVITAVSRSRKKKAVCKVTVN